jgi:hypothetical protein
VTARSHSDIGGGAAPYDVVKMKAELEDAFAIVGRRIQNEFVAAFRQLYPDDRVPFDLSTMKPAVAATPISSVADIRKVFRTAGFYIILTDYPVEANQCRLTRGSLRAVYRGECAEVRLRVMSHLANTAYRQGVEQSSHRYMQIPKNAGRQFYKSAWPHCLKLEKGGRSGIDVEDQPYAGYKWLVLAHPMVGSSQAVRKLAEAAFDEAFGHPAASRDD